MRDRQVTCPYCGEVILSDDNASVLSHQTECRPTLTATAYRDPETRLCYKWTALQGWRLWRGSKVLGSVAIQDVIDAVNSGSFKEMKQ